MKNILLITDFEYFGKGVQINLVKRIAEAFNSTIHLLQIIKESDERYIDLIEAQMKFFAEEHGIEKYAGVISQNIAQAFYLSDLIMQESSLELLSPVTMNIVCYRFIIAGLSTTELKELNKEIVIQLQEQGIASPSSTILNGEYAIRVCIVNHRSQYADFELLVKETIRIGRELRC